MSFCWQCIIQVLLLLLTANGIPVLARDLFGSKFSKPIDCGVTAYDNRPLFGYSKTWRGLLTSVFFTGLIAPLFNISLSVGVLFAVFVMLGDLISSFIKRRLGFVESSRYRIIDVIPESALPILVLQYQLELTMLESIVCIIFFFILEVVLSPILYFLKIRKRPY